MDGSFPVIRAEDLARTYDGGAYADPWDAVLDYRAAPRYVSKHPNKSSAALSTALELPRGRLRGWIDDGGAPDAVRAIETAREHGWIDIDYDGPPMSVVINAAFTHLLESEKNINDARGKFDSETIQAIANTSVIGLQYRTSIESKWRWSSGYSFKPQLGQ